MNHSTLHDTIDSARETTMAAARQVGEGFGQATETARHTRNGIGGFRAALRDQPLVMAAVMLAVGYFLRTMMDVRHLPRD